MPPEESISVTNHLTLIQIVDDQIPTSDPHRLPRWLRQQLDLRQGLTKLELLVRNGFNAIGAIRATVITEAERGSVFASYGWTGCRTTGS